MWGKGQSIRSTRPVIGNPILLNKTLDDSVYCSLSPISSLSDYETSQDSTADNTDSAHRIASSIYSRDEFGHPAQPRSSWRRFPSGQHGSDHKPSGLVCHEALEISPPVSPDFMENMDDAQNDIPVSPIEEGLPKNVLTKGGTHVSNLPASHKLTPKEGFLSSPPPNIPRSELAPKPHTSVPVAELDKSSSEAITRAAGRTVQIGRTNVPFQLRAAPTQPAEQRPGILSWGKKFAETRSRLVKGENTLPPLTRSHWGGANEVPPSNPAQGRQREQPPSRAGQDSNGRQMTPQFTIAPGFRSTVVTTITAGELEEPKSFKSRRDYLPSTRPSQNISITLPYLDLPQSTSKDALNSALADWRLEEQPQAQFSPAVDGPTTPSTVSSKPRHMDSTVEAPATGSIHSIMSRKRPVPSGMVLGKKPARKPVPSQVSKESNAKLGPECSGGKVAVSRIDALEAKKNTLTQRKMNIESIIHELTHVIQPSSIASEAAVREEIRETVIHLNSELADIRREDHEIGLALFRAYKKRDEQEHYGSSTGLWVKRITS